MRPSDLEVGAFGIVGRAFHAHFVDSVAGIERATELIPLGVTECRLQRPTASGVDVAQNLEVHVVVDGPVITAVFEVEASVGRLAERRYDDARTLSLAVRNQCKRRDDRQRRLFELEIQPFGYNLIFRDDDGLVEMKLEMRMLAVAARGERARLDVDFSVVHLLDAVTVQVVLVVLGENLGDDAFLGVEVETHLVGEVFLPSLRKDRLSYDTSSAVRHSLGVDGVLLEVEFHVVGLNLDVVVLDDRATVIVYLVMLEILYRRVVAGTVYLRLDSRLIILIINTIHLVLTSCRN